MAESTDAVVVVVSEETGRIEVLRNNEQTTIATQDELQTLLRSYMGSDVQKNPFWLNDIRFFWQKIRAVFRLVRKKEGDRTQAEVKR